MQISLDSGIIMKIKIAEKIRSKNIKEQPKITFLESHDIRGAIEIKFSYSGEVFKLENANVPLFFAETIYFVKQIRENSQATWLMQFEPFLLGKLNGENLDIVDRAGKIIELLDGIGYE